MSIDEIDAALAELNAQIDSLKALAREHARARDAAIAEAKVAAMPEAEKAALLALLKQK